MITKHFLIYIRNYDETVDDGADTIDGDHYNHEAKQIV